MAKVSIVIPIYNVEKYLKECLDSVVSQTLNDIEIICVNDGSTDSSLMIIDEYSKQDNRIIVITGENGGYGKAMNKGLSRASGEYIGIVEPDDYVSLAMFGDLYSIAKGNNLDFVKADFYRFITNQTGEKEYFYEALDSTNSYYNKLLNPSQTPYLIRFPLNTWSGIYKREFLNRYHIRHNETPGASFQDNGFFFQTFAYATRAMFINKPYYMNRRDNPNSSVKSKEKVYCMNIEYDYIRDILKQAPEVWERFKYMYWWKKYHNYIFTLNRIDKSFKKDFVIRMGNEFKRAAQLDELKESEFSPSEWNTINALIQNGEKYYRCYVAAPKWQLTLRKMIPKPIKNIAKSIWGRIRSNG